MENIDFLKVMLFSHGYDRNAEIIENNGQYTINVENRFFDGRIDFVNYSFIETVRMIQSQMHWDHDKIDEYSKYFRFFENENDVLLDWKREALLKYSEFWWNFFINNLPSITDNYWDKVKEYYKYQIKNVAEYLYGQNLHFWLDDQIILEKIEDSTNGILITYTDYNIEHSINVNDLNGIDDNPQSIRRWFRLLIEAGFENDLFPPSFYVGK